MNPNKVAAVTASFWGIKICATTLGETAGDLLTMTLGLGYAGGSVLLLSAFAALLLWQLRAQRFSPARYWPVMLATSTAGTTISDFLDRSAGLGYATGAAVIASTLALVLLLWRCVEGSLAVDRITSPRAEGFYWLAMLVSNTLGTALGDYLADDSGLGFMGGALLIGALLALLVMLWRYSRLSPVLLFWLAFVLTRPFGATFGDLLTKPVAAGGLGGGTAGASLVLLALMLVGIWWGERRAARAG